MTVGVDSRNYNHDVFVFISFLISIVCFIFFHSQGKFDQHHYGSLQLPLFPRNWNQQHENAIEEFDQDSSQLDDLQNAEPWETWEKILFLLQLIPCRSLNSLLLAEEFEKQMNDYSQQHDFGDWDLLILYVSLMCFLCCLLIC
jgi:hypothetical protein